MVLRTRYLGIPKQLTETGRSDGQEDNGIEPIFDSEEVKRYKENTCMRCGGPVTNPEIMKFRGDKFIGRCCSYKCSREIFELGGKNEEGS
jgi:hypothetical protein